MWKAEKIMGCEQQPIGKYLKVERLPQKPKRKTAQWDVVTNQNTILGTVQWFSRWRQYCFDPRDACTFNADCLDDISKFLRQVNFAHWKIKHEVEEMLNG